MLRIAVFEAAVRLLPLYILKSTVGLVPCTNSFPAALTFMICCSYCPLAGTEQTKADVIDAPPGVVTPAAVKLPDKAGNIKAEVEVPPTCDGTNAFTPELIVVAICSP